MSELRRIIRPLVDQASARRLPSRFDGLRRRLPFYAAAVIFAVLFLGWIDGGEEPIRPIVQTINAMERG